MPGPSGLRSTPASKAKRSVSGHSGSATTTVSADQFRELKSTITAMQDKMDEKPAKFQDEIQQGQEEAVTRATKRSRYNKPYIFRKCDNEEQTSFNAKVNETLVQAEIDLSGVKHV